MKIIVDYSEQTEAIEQINIIAAKLIGEYQIEITFSDGKVNPINFAPFY